MYGLPNCVMRSAELQQETTETIAGATGGMFLLAKLYLTSLKRKRSSNAVRGTLRKISQRYSLSDNSSGQSEVYDSAYQITMERIEQQGDEQAQLAKEVIAWVTFVKNTIRASGLRGTLGILVGDTVFDEGNCPDIEDMISACAGLVTVDPETNLVRLAHYTTYEYFVRSQHHWFPDPHGMILDACLTILSLEVFAKEMNKEERDSIVLELPLHSYAAHNWGVPCSPGDRYSVTKYGPMGHFANNAVTPLHLAAYLRLEDAIEVLSQEKDVIMNVRDYLGRTPLMIAVQNSHDHVVEQLIGYGACIQVHCGLIYGHKKDCDDSVIELESRGRHWSDSRHTVDVKPLSRDCSKKTFQLTRMTTDTALHYYPINRGADPDIEDVDGNIPWSVAVEKDYTEGIELLKRQEEHPKADEPG
ncbi:ankyrin repeat domain containing protein [Pyrenophora tritici-repentis]|nr:ankyrin repeat domain containing protein [Pyrenophora tritici-repentis]